MVHLSRNRQDKLIAAIIFSFILICLHYNRKPSNVAKSHLKVVITGGDIDRNLKAKPGSTGAGLFQLRGQTCLIPKLDINGSEVKDFFFKAESLKCFKNSRNWVFIDDSGNVRYIDERKNAQCKGYYVTWKSTSDNTYTAFDALPNGKPMRSDFAVVSCTDGWQKWNGILMSVVRRSDEKLLNKGTKSKDGTRLNLYFLGFDSLSQMSFRRKLPRSVKVIEETLEAVVLNGYNIVGDGTPQAFIPILTAFTEEELPLTRKRFREAHYIDDVYPMIWSNFSSAGYVTLYGEDSYEFDAFTYRLKGFRSQPTDHYLRPIFKEIEKEGGGYCLGSEPLHTTWFRYSREFMRVYKDMPRFLMMHQGVFSHDDINLVEVEDEDLAFTLTKMHQSGELDDALVVVMADHGHRFAKLRETHQGQLEERLPFFAISLPAKFRRTNYGKMMYNNLLKNKDRLTTPFDIHATLMDLLQLPEDLITMQNPKKRSLSLFRPIPKSRTCAQAGVDAHWCTCLNWKNALSTVEDKEISQKLAVAVVDVINGQLKDVSHLCAKLSLQELLDAKKLVSNEDLLKYKNAKDKDGFVPNLSGDTKIAFAHYQIKLRTKPGNAIYEVTLFYDYVLNVVHIDMASFSRINKYGDAPHCIIELNYFLAPYCVCHDKVSSTND